MSTGFCAACGARADIEQHHVGSRVLNPDVTIPLCTRCHRFELTVRQRAQGVPWQSDHQAQPGDSIRALLFGICDLIEVSQRRSSNEPLCRDAATVAVLTRRAVGHLLDLLHPDSPPWKTRPDIHLRQTHVTNPAPGSEPTRLVSLAELITTASQALDLASLHKVASHLLTTPLAREAADGWDARCRADPSLDEDATRLIQDINSRQRDLALAVLDLTDLNDAEDGLRLIKMLQGWLSAMMRLWALTGLLSPVPTLERMVALQLP